VCFHVKTHDAILSVVSDLYDFGFVLLDEPTAVELQDYHTFARPEDLDVNDYYYLSGFQPFCLSPELPKPLQGFEFVPPFTQGRPLASNLGLIDEIPLGFFK
jgi:hypothetical protein